jgi:CRISPR system Cascade subunit CasB
MSAEKAKTRSWPELTVVGTVVDQRIRALQAGMLANRSASVAALARLRRAAGKKPGDVNDILEHTLHDGFVSPGAGDTPTAAETAAHIGMTLYAVHQQSRSKPMHRRGHGFGSAVRVLHPTEPASPPEPVLRRFHALGTADSLDELVYHARGMVTLLRAKQVPLDYGLLADQLLRWQQPGGPAAIRLHWGRDFYRTPRNDDPADNDQS